MTIVAPKSLCWTPLNDPSGNHEYITCGKYLVVRMRWTARDTTYTVTDNTTDREIITTSDYGHVLDIITNQ